ncbi:hypothetical protein DFP72DRAFT_946018 [Ephemerocybe angulata]|uniref:Uncharacterized protein n=1 Tax=Ephemerocybe angulata TaxID=980116 RepID=A0A8H6H781_9AGAR|nr:hypothetical protein DFP72DRAFT_946018 [Tulosesus angulatus]
MHFCSLLATVVALATLAVASPKPQQVGCREVFFPDDCAPGEVKCDAAGSIMICCQSC